MHGATIKRVQLNICTVVSSGLADEPQQLEQSRNITCIAKTL